MQIKILSFNVWDIPFWFSVKRHERIHRLGHYLKEINPDVICLQEAFDVKHRADLRELLGKEIYDETEGNGKTRRILLFKRFDLTGGLVVFSKLPIIKSAFHPFRRFVDMMFAEYIGRKGVLQVIVATPKGPLMIMNTHFHTGSLSIDRQVRLKQMKQLIKAAHAAKEMPVVVLGDFNEHDMTKHQDYIPLLRKGGLQDAASDANKKEEAKPTVRLGNRYHSKTWFNRSRVSKRLDYILVKNLGPAGLKITEYKVLEQPKDPISDHDPLVVTIE